MVLWMAWLKLLDLITTNYSCLTMSLSWRSQNITLQGCTGPGLTEATHGQVKRLLDIAQVRTFFHLQLQDTTNLSDTTTTLPLLKLGYLLDQCSPLFRQPTSLPPIRPIDHTIHLVPNSQAVNVRPYWYPCFQKQEIEKQVKGILQRNLIRPNRSLILRQVCLLRRRTTHGNFASIIGPQTPLPSRIGSLCLPLTNS